MPGLTVGKDFTRGCFCSVELQKDGDYEITIPHFFDEMVQDRKFLFGLWLTFHTSACSGLPPPVTFMGDSSQLLVRKRLGTDHWQLTTVLVSKVPHAGKDHRDNQFGGVAEGRVKQSADGVTRP